MTTTSDQMLVQQLRNPATRRTAFSHTVEKYSSRLYWYIRHMVLTHDDANDVLQNTFIKAWLNIDNFKGDSMLSTWLYKIAINESLQFLRQRKEMMNIDDPDLDLERRLESDTYFDGDETSIQLQKAVARLPEKQRIIFNMKYFQDMKYEEMSEVMDTSVGALKASYHHAVKKIEDFFQQLD